MKHTGSCHCGRVAFEVEGEIAQALACNCSICRRRGSLLWFVGRDALTVRTPDDAAATYLFNRHAIRHRFCPSCGIHVWGEGVNPKDGQPMAAVNLRVLDGVDLASVPVTHFDGASL